MSLPYEERIQAMTDSRQEHDDFVAGSEDMERRAMALEADRAWKQEALYARMDQEDAIRVARLNEAGNPWFDKDGRLDPEGKLLGPMPKVVVVNMVDSEDDIPF